MQRYRARLTTDFPNLKITAMQMIGSGWHHDAIEVNGEIIFRIPRFDHDSDITDTSVGYETAILRILRGKLDVEIPNPIYIAPDKSYFGYPKLNGEILGDLWHSFGEAEQDRIIEQWVNVVAPLHQAIDTETARDLGVPLFSGPNDLIDGTARRIYDIEGLDPLVCVFADQVLTQSAQIDVASRQDTMIHNDLHLQNMLIDPVTHELTGVIDWTDICIGPLEREFCTWEWEHDDSLEKAVTRYQCKTSWRVDLSEARFWKHIETLSDIVEAAESGDQQKVDDSVEHIRYWSQASAIHDVG